MKCLILAGGFGSRLYPLTIDQPKALLGYRGKPLSSYIVEKVPRDIDIMVSTNKRFEADLRQWQKTLDRPVEILVEGALAEREKMGAVSSIDYWIKCKNITDDLVIAADNYFEFEMARFIHAYDGRNTLVAVCDVGQKEKARNFGVVRLSERRIVELEEKPAQPKSTLVATACYIFASRILCELANYCLQGRRDNLGSFISHLIATDEVSGFLFTDLWFDIGSQIEIVRP